MKLSELMRLLAGTLFLQTFLAAALAAAPATEQDAGTLATTFTLADQYGKRHRLEYPQEKICVLVFADKWGSTQVESWVRPLYERYKDTIMILGVAQLANVPGKIQPLLINLFKSKIKFPVLLDWTGEVARQYGYPGGQALVVVIDPRGMRLHQATGKATPALLQPLCAVIDELKAAGPPPPAPAHAAVQQAQGQARQQRAAQPPGQGND